MTQPLTPSSALITGASSGIGEEIARELARRGANVVLVARSEGKLQELARELIAQHGIQAHVLPVDLTSADAGQQLEQGVQKLGLNVDILVNNAGFGFFGEFREQPAEDIHRMIAVNISALTDLTRRFLPGMMQRGRGRVLNVASTAAFQPGPLMAVYYATKAYVLSFSEAVNEELRTHPAAKGNVSVTALCPGPVQTGFQAASDLNRSKLIHGPMKLAMLSAKEVANIGVTAMLSGQSTVIAGTINQLVALSPRLLPRAAMTRMMSAIQGRREK